VFQIDVVVHDDVDDGCGSEDNPDYELFQQLKLNRSHHNLQHPVDHVGEQLK
jgi:hypothetical protein